MYRFALVASLLPLPTLLSAQSQSNISVASNRAASFELGGRTLNVYPDLQNYAPERKARVKSWRFFVDPTLMPRFGDDGQLAVETRRFRVTGPRSVAGGYEYSVFTRFEFRMRLRDDQQIEKAADAVTKQNPLDPDSPSIEPYQISTLPVHSIRFRFEALDNSGCKTVADTIHTGGNPAEIALELECEDKVFTTARRLPDKPALPRATWLNEELPRLKGTAFIQLEARAVSVATVQIEAAEFRTARLFASVGGEGGEVLVSRYDLRALQDDLVKSAQLRFRGRQLTEEERKRCVLDELSKLEPRSVELTRFSEEMLSRTYNREDLAPTQVKRFFDERIDKTSTERLVKINGSGGGSFLGIIEGDAALSSEDFKKRAEEHGVKTEFEGEKWVPKSLTLLHVNSSEFRQRVERGCTIETFSEGQPWAVVATQVVLRPHGDK